MKSEWSQDVYVKAWDYATLAHHGQTYAGPREGMKYDYINHIGSVTMELIWSLGGTGGVDGNLALQCAILHDSIEDTTTTYENLVNTFGKKVADGVQALTKNEALSTKAEQMSDSLARIKLQPSEVWMVKLSDRITNLSEPPYYWSKEKRSKYLHEARFILAELGSSNQLLAERLASRIASYQQYL